MIGLINLGYIFCIAALIIKECFTRAVMSLHTLHYIQSFQVAVLINYGQLLAIFSNNTALDKYQIKLSHSTLVLLLLRVRRQKYDRSTIAVRHIKNIRLRCRENLELFSI